MIGKIGFDHHRIQCIIGDLPDERMHQQEIFVDLRVEADISACGKSDLLNDTVDYVSLARLSTNLAQENRYQLLEAYVYDLANAILKDEKVLSVYICVKKPKGLPSAQYSVVELEVKQEVK